MVKRWSAQRYVIRDLDVRKVVPRLFLNGLESGGKNVKFEENGGVLVIRNETDGVDYIKIDMVNLLVAILQILQITLNNPYLELKGTETNAKVFRLQEAAGMIKLNNVTDNVDEFIIDTVNNLIKFNLNRPFYADKSWIFNTGLISLALGKGCTPAETTLLDISGTNIRMLIPLAVYIDIGGTVASNETVTVYVYVYDDAGESYGPIAGVIKTGTVGAESYTADFTKLLDVPDGRRIVKITVKACTTATSSNATASAKVVGVKL